MPSFDNSPQDGAAEYCDKRVCFDSDSSLALDYCARYQVSVCTYAHLSVCVCMCLSVRDHIFGTTRPIFTKFLCVLPMVVARSSSGGVVIHYVLPVLWMASRAESAVYDCLVVLTVYSITSKCAM